MVRIKRSVNSKKSRRKTMKQAKGYTGARSRTLRAAKEQVMHAGADAFTHRKDKKADFRKLWISRINAAARMHDLSYSKFIFGLNNADIKVDRKILADIAVNDPEGFKKLVEVAKDNLNPTYKQLQTGVREKEKVETKSESATKS
jgi:large subunit ribosomal protein L20